MSVLRNFVPKGSEEAARPSILCMTKDGWSPSDVGLGSEYISTSVLPWPNVHDMTTMPLPAHD